MGITGCTCATLTHDPHGFSDENKPQIIQNRLKQSNWLYIIQFLPILDNLGLVWELMGTRICTHTCAYPWPKPMQVRKPMPFTRLEALWKVILYPASGSRGCEWNACPPYGTDNQVYTTHDAVILTKSHSNATTLTLMFNTLTLELSVSHCVMVSWVMSLST